MRQEKRSGLCADCGHVHRGGYCAEVCPYCTGALVYGVPERKPDRPQYDAGGRRVGVIETPAEEVFTVRITVGVRRPGGPWEEVSSQLRLTAEEADKLTARVGEAIRAKNLRAV